MVRRPESTTRGLDRFQGVRSEQVRRRLGHENVSERRACRALGQPRSTQRYRPRKPDADRRLIAELRRLVGAYPYGNVAIQVGDDQPPFRLNCA